MAKFEEIEKIKSALKAGDQDDLVDFLSHSTGFHVDHPIVKQLLKVNVADSLLHFKNAQVSALSYESVSPVGEVLDWTTSDSVTKDQLVAVGIEAIKNQKVGAVILSGGQGTRLGFSGPKGMYSIGLASNKTIFQLHIERVMKVRTLSRGTNDGSTLPRIPIYIMTSDLNDQIIRNYFAEVNYFGYPAEDVIFFEQGLQPCITLDGKIIVESPTALSMAPDGNGGIYDALRTSGVFDDICSRGVEYLHVYGIDNILTKSLDPAFIGYCIQQKAQCGNKVVWRANKAEKVGVTATSDGRMCVLEYSELPSHLGDAEDADGKLLFGAANICNHFLATSFLRDKVFPNLSGTYHLAKKKIPFYDAASGATVIPTSINGVKLEMFIFDVFPLAERWAVMEVAREDEFAPVKNEPGNAVDSPDTARTLLSAQAVRWLRGCGAVVEGEADGFLCEVSPLLSYAGEGLDHFAGRTVSLPCYLDA